MKSKLNLTIEENLLDIAKAKARELGISLSQLFEMYLQSFTREDVRPSDFVRKIPLKGLSVPEDFDYKKELPNIISRKYVKGRH